MSEAKGKEQGDRPKPAGEAQPLKTPDALEACNALGQTIRSIQDANPNRHSGTAGGDQEFSLQIAADNGQVINRGSKLTEKDLIRQSQKSHELSQTGAELARLAKDNPVLDPVAKLRKYADDLPAGEEKDKLINLSREQGAEHSPELRLRLTGKVEQSAISEQALFECVSKLPLDQQAQVLSSAFLAFDRELDRQAFRIKMAQFTGIGEGVIGMVDGTEKLGKAVCEVAQFSRDVCTNNPRALDTAESARQSFGNLLVGGIRVWDIADSYLGSVGADSYYGDNTSAFRDIAWLGDQMNQKWASMSQEEKIRLSSRIGTENLGALAAGSGLTKLTKSMDVTGALQELGASASDMGQGVRQKYSNCIAAFIKELAPRRKLSAAGGMVLDEAEQKEAKDFIFERRLFKPPKDGRELTPGKAAEAAGIHREDFEKLGPLEKAIELVKRGFKIIDQRRYHIDGCDQPLSEAAMVKRLKVSKEELRQMSASDLKEHGITPIEPVKGGLPRNYKYAGKTYLFSEQHPKEYEKLCREFPQLAEQFSKGVQFTKEGYPTFEPFTVAEDYKFKQGLFTGREADFAKADEATWPHLETAKARAKERKRLGLTWHHCEDGHTLQLVPKLLHGKVPHTGGIAIVKALKGI